MEFKNSNAKAPSFSSIGTLSSLLPTLQSTSIQTNCKLCEIGTSCLHNGLIPPVQVNFNYDSNFIKDIMFAAWLLKGCYQSVGPLVTVPQHMHSKVQPIDATASSSPILTVTKSEAPLEPTNISNTATYRCNGASTQPASQPFIPYQIFSYQQPSGQYYQPLMPPPAPVPAHTGYSHDLLYPPASNVHRRYLQLPPPSEPYTLTQPIPHSFYNLNHQILNQTSGHAANNSVIDPYQSMPMFPSQGHFYPVAPMPYGQPSFQTNVQSRNFTFAEPMTTNTTYQNCPCPMQTCPKNVHTGPLTGNSSSKRSGKVPLSPVALALPLEPSSVGNPPSPARGSAGMPPPPSPAGAMYQTNLSPPQIISLSSPLSYSQPPSLLSVSTNSSSAVTKTSSATLLMCHDHRPIITDEPAASVIKQEVCSPSEKDKDSPNTRWYLPTNIVSTTNISTMVTTTSHSTMTCTSTEIKSTILETKNNKPLPIIEQIEVSNNHSDEKSAPIQKLLLNTKKVQNCPKTFNKSSYKNLIKKTSVYSLNDTKRTCSSILNDEESKPKKLKSSMKTSIVSNEEDTSNNSLNTKSSIDNTIDYVINMYRNKSINVIVNNKPKDDLSIELPIKLNLDKLPEPIITEKETIETSNDKKSSLDEKNIEQTSIKLIKPKINNSSSTNNTSKLKSNKKISIKKDDTKTTIKKNSKTKKKRTKYKKKVNAANSTKVETQSLVVKVQKKVLKTPRWSNGWIWEGEPFEATVFLNCDDNKVVRKCYSSMRHVSGDRIQPRDCVLLLAGSRSTELPFIAKIASLWESPIDGEMMLSLLWYYRPDSKTHHSQELYASKHKDVSSVACIDDKCYVLTFNEYCRFHKFLQRIEEGIDHETLVVPQLNSDIYQRSNILPPTDVNPELVYFCRSVYDYRQKKIIKSPFLANYFDKN